MVPDIEFLAIKKDVNKVDNLEGALSTDYV